jgi:helicase
MIPMADQDKPSIDEVHTIDEINVHPWVKEVVKNVWHINTLYPPQYEALRYIPSGTNFVLPVPTASGKTLVGYVAMLNTLFNSIQIERRSKVVFVVPLRALADEKYRELVRISEYMMDEHGVPIEVLLAVGNPEDPRYQIKPETLRKADIIIGTAEKIDSLVRNHRFLFDTIGVLVIDEVHTISDRFRGSVVEILITKALATWTVKKVSTGQLICLSATIGNYEEIAKWIQSPLIDKRFLEWRPVTLLYGVTFSSMLKWYDAVGPTGYVIKKGHIKENEPPWEIRVKTNGGFKRVDQPTTVGDREIEDLVKESVFRPKPGTKHTMGEQVLVFCKSRKIATDMAKSLGAQLHGTSQLKLMQDVRFIGLTWNDLMNEVVTLKLGEVLGLKDEVCLLPEEETMRVKMEFAGIKETDVQGLKMLDDEFIKKYNEQLLMGKTPMISYTMQKWLNLISNRISTKEEPTPEAMDLMMALGTAAGYHHAGLSDDEKSIIEKSFRMGIMRVLASTPTLCLHPDTYISTERGPIKISEIQKGDKVLTHTGTYKTVLDISRTHFDGDLLTIKAQGYIPISMTPNHRVLIDNAHRHSIHSKKYNEHWWAYDGPEWKLAKDIVLKEGDGNRTEVLRPILDINTEPEDIKIKIHDNDIVGRNQFGSVFPHPQAMRIPAKINIDEEMAEWIGLYVAEGFTGRNGIIGFGISTMENDLTFQILKVFYKLQLYPIVNDATRHRRVIRACSKLFADYLDTNFGRRAPNKHFPQEYISSNEDIIKALLRGAWKGDGTYTTKNPISASYSTTSIRLAEQMMLMLERLGYTPSIDIIKPRKSKTFIQARHIQYAIKLSGKQSRKFIRDVMKDKSEQHIGNREYNIRTIVNGMIHTPIESINNIKYQGDVFNLHIEDDESYVCTGSFIVHNSAGINLPAHRVIVSDVKRWDGTLGYPVDIPIAEMKQMLGRAARPQVGQDIGTTIGEGIIFTNRGPISAENIAKKYILSPPENVTSKLSDVQALKLHILGLVSTEFTETRETIDKFMDVSFYAQTLQLDELRNNTSKAVDYLLTPLAQEPQLSSDIEQDERRLTYLSYAMIMTKEDKFIATEFGRVVSRWYIMPQSGVYLKRLCELLYTNQVKVPEEQEIEKRDIKQPHIGVLHYICSLYDMKETLRFVSPQEVQSMNMAMSEHQKKLIKPYPSDVISRDAYRQQLKAALVLHDWIDGLDERSFLQKYDNVAHGDLMRLVDMAKWLLNSMEAIARRFDYIGVATYANMMAERIRFGSPSQEVALRAIKGIGRVKAKMLVTGGIISIEALSKATPDMLANAGVVGRQKVKTRWVATESGRNRALDFIDQAKSIMQKIQITQY